ncbi:hypothetical protein STHAL_33470 [Streptomyces halstedii]|uniref:Uncharacterized protein n=1 Tax=Streptomyces halstedii TaxID=1944 RepID=A0ABS6U1E6_STRHA|nr:hypothetical protein [Streptomyces halstedii]MBV7674356.1 hypothetical protein [Streptomyces halstedii]
MTSVDTVTSPATDAGSAADIRSAVRGGGAAITALCSGSVVLAGRACRCVGTAARWAWDQASIDTGATAERQARADRKARAAAAKVAAKAAKARKAAADEDDEDDDEDEAVEAADVVAAPVAPVRRPVLEALAMLAFGAGLAGGALATVVPLVVPYVQALAPWRSAILTVGSLAWMVAAWMVSPPPAPAPAEDAEDQEDEDQEEDAAPGDSPADRLARFVLEQLAELEAAGRRGVHVTALVTSAEEAGLLAPGAMDKTRMRAWLPASGIPVTKSVKVRGDVDYGLSIAHVTKALGMSPGEALRRLSGEAPEAPAEAPSGEAPAAPAEAPVEAPVEAAPEPPVEALPPARLTLVKPPSPTEAPASDRGAA